MNFAKQAAVDYILNRFCPYIIISFLLFTKFKFTDFEPYVIVGLVYYLDKFSFNVGHSVGAYQNNIEFRNRVDKNLNE